MYQWIDELKHTQNHLQTEIAELKKKEAHLQQSLAILRSTLESTAYGVVTVSLDGEIVNFNQKFVDMWQMPNSLLLSKSYIQYQDFCQKQLKYPLPDHQLLGKVDILKLKDGRTFAQYFQPQWLEGEIIGKIWSIWDVTESTEIEQFIQLNQVSLYDWIKVNNVSIFVIKSGQLYYVNPAAEIITGYTKKELLTGFDACQLFKNKKPKQVENKDLEYQEIKILEKTGTERWLACAVAILDKPETPMEVIAGIDITEYKQAELHLNQSLENIKQLREIKADFMSMVCHQFRNPLNVISFSNSLLKRHINESQEETTRQLIDHIQSGVEHLTKMLEDILVFAKVEAVKLNYDAQLLNLVDFCNQLIEKMQISAGDQRINFVSQGSHIKACMDQTLLQPMIANLLDNAMKYSDQDSVIDFKLFYECGKVVFQVTDRGVGIPITDQQRLFEPFYRGSNIPNLPGTGLGLSVVKTLVDLHKGHIAVESEVGVSTTFTIMLPTVKLNS